MKEAVRTLTQKHVTNTGHESRMLYHSPTDCVRCCAVGDREAAEERANGDTESSSRETRLIRLWH